MADSLLYYWFEFAQVGSLHHPQSSKARVPVSLFVQSCVVKVMAQSSEQCASPHWPCASAGGRLSLFLFIRSPPFFFFHSLPSLLSSVQDVVKVMSKSIQQYASSQLPCAIAEARLKSRSLLFSPFALLYRMP